VFTGPKIDLIDDYLIPLPGKNTLWEYYMVRDEAVDWFEEAKVDLRRAERALNDQDYSLACFMSQQAVERYLRHTILGYSERYHPHDLTFSTGVLRSLFNYQTRLKSLYQSYPCTM